MYLEKPKWPIIWKGNIVYMGTPLSLSSLQNSFLYRRFISIFVLQNYQVPYLDQWTDIEGEHSSCLRGVTTALHNASLRLPVIGDVKVKFPFKFSFRHKLHQLFFLYHVVKVLSEMVAGKMWGNYRRAYLSFSTAGTTITLHWKFLAKGKDHILKCVSIKHWQTCCI